MGFGEGSECSDYELCSAIRFDRLVLGSFGIPSIFAGALGDGVAAAGDTGGKACNGKQLPRSFQLMYEGLTDKSAMNVLAESEECSKWLC